MSPIASNMLRAAAFVPPLLLCALVYRYGVDLPLFDQWEFVRVLETIRDGQLSGLDIARDLFHGHNEHRLFFPRISMVLLAQPSDWNIRLELFFNLLLAGVLFVALQRIASTLSLSQAWRATLLFLLSFCAFNPMQWENWSWGWQIQIFSVVTGVGWACYLLTRVAAIGHFTKAQAWRLGLAVAAALVATFSFANGLLIWPVGLLVLLLSRPYRGWPQRYGRQAPS